MRALLRPTLARRVFLSIVLAFVIVCGVLTAYNYYATFLQPGNDIEVGMVGVAQSLDSALASYASDDAAGAAAESYQRLIFAQERRVSEDSRGNPRIDALHLRVWNLQGKLLYGAPDLPRGALVPAGTGIQEVASQGMRYRVVHRRSTRLDIELSQRIESHDLAFFGLLARQLSVYLIIAFPLVLIPVWLAVYSGLRPLRLLSSSIQGRPEHDLTPFRLETPYAELKPLLRALNDLLARLARKAQQERAFVNDAAHELRTPLAVIASEAHVQATASGPIERQAARQRMDGAIARASHLIGQMLSLARLEAQSIVPRQPVDVARLTRELLADRFSTAVLRGVDLSLNAPDSVILEGDPTRLYSILDNLVDNALRYIGPGRHVVVTVREWASMVELTVADDGPGVPAADRARVFDRFWRCPGNDLPGSGLGLAIVKEATLGMGGTVSLTDGLGGDGCAFVIELPRNGSTEQR